MKKYETVVCCGTFDFLHNGHKEFIRYAFLEGERVVLGLTSDKFVTQFKDNSDIEPFDDRKIKLEEFLKSRGLRNYEIVPIDDAYGFAISKEYKLDAIIVTDETKKNAYRINEVRKGKNLKPLDILIFEQINADDGKPITSTRIRNGEINRQGKVYVGQSIFTKTFYLPDDLREELRKPFGKLFPSGVASFPPRFPPRRWNSLTPKDLSASKTITVGDVVTKSFNQAGFGQWLSVVDFRVARKNKFTEMKELGFLGNEKVIKVNNPSGSITAELTGIINILFRSADFSSRIIIKIDGEEDLAVLPVILVSPLGSTIFYGQPNQGVVKVDVNEDTKKKAYKIISKFTTVHE